MSELLEFYQKEASANFSTIPWLSSLQKQGVSDFLHLGFPTSRIEDWKYTKLDNFLKQSFNRADLQSRSSTLLNDYTVNFPAHHKISITNGNVHISEDLSQSGIIIKTIAKAAIENPELVKKYLTQIVKQENAFQALNTAMLNTGIFIYLPQGCVLTQPLLLSHWQDQKNQAVYIRHLVIAEKDSQISLVEDYSGSDDMGYFTNTITEIFLAENARVKHYKMQREGLGAYHIGHVAITQKQKSNSESHLLNLGGNLVRSDTTINLVESHAHCLMNGIYTPKDKQHTDHHTKVTHLVPDCSSTQDYKGILLGKSRAVFNGKVVVEKDAVHTQAKQQNKNILLSPQAEINTKPQLEIFADDVICTHGATVGQLDEDALFYLACRGIDFEEASEFLVQAFAAENLSLFGPFSAWVGGLLQEKLR
jgi:Fe-S cluster assembly protein SufD